MRISGVWFLAITLLTLLAGLPPLARAVEEGQLQKKDGRWEYVPSEDPGLKYLLLKGIITQDEYDKGLKVLETKERIVKPNFNIDVNNGLNIRVGSKFLLKMRLLTQVRYSYSTYNDAWGTVGDSRNEEILGGQVEFRAFKRQSGSSQFTVPRAQLQFLGYAFDPDLRYNVSLAMDSTPFNQEGGNGRAALQDAYVSSWHIPWATVQVGQQRVWFNRALISSAATLTFADNMMVQNVFASNLQSSRDVGINILSDEDQYKFNYAIGIWGGVGANLARDGTSVSQRVLPPTGGGGPSSGTTRTYNYDTRFLSGELMYTARVLYKIAGNPGYGQGDILNSRTLQSAIGFGYAYDPAQNYLSAIRSDIVDRSYRQAVARAMNGRLLGGGIYDFQTYETDFIAKYQGWSLQAEGYYRHQRVRNKDAGTIPFDLSTIPTSPLAVGPPVDLGQAWGWYVQVGKYIIPRKLELAVRYGVLDPSTKQKDDLTKEFGAAINYSFDGTYNNRLVIDYSNITMGSGGRAPDRFPFENQPGFGRDLIENRINVQYQFYF
ncbi:MAG: hypothetical protein E6K65_14625 [Nitrospirae bacterium]|nr:MAG: hypothetical protein E6K65_14625 [Nitrospirota bacterium]